VTESPGRGGFSPAYLNRVGSSFTDFLAAAAPELLPSRRPVPQVAVGDVAPHGTTIVSVVFDGGVLMGGDRRATMGNLISQRDIAKAAANAMRGKLLASRFFSSIGVPVSV